MTRIEPVIARHTVAGALLPCVFGAAIKELKHQIKLHQPVLVVCTGLAGGQLIGHVCCAGAALRPS